MQYRDREFGAWTLASYFGLPPCLSRVERLVVRVWMQDASLHFLRLTVLHGYTTKRGNRGVLQNMDQINPLWKVFAYVRMQKLQDDGLLLGYARPHFRAAGQTALVVVSTRKEFGKDHPAVACLLRQSSVQSWKRLVFE